MGKEKAKEKERKVVGRLTCLHGWRMHTRGMSGAQRWGNLGIFFRGFRSMSTHLQIPFEFLIVIHGKC